jgi:hypothetical protein
MVPIFKTGVPTFDRTEKLRHTVVYEFNEKSEIQKITPYCIQSK